MPACQLSSMNQIGSALRSVTLEVKSTSSIVSQHNDLLYLYALQAMLFGFKQNQDCNSWSTFVETKLSRARYVYWLTLSLGQNLQKLFWQLW